ncbi:response regulator transcription factor [Streptomyces sp. NPDC002851]
MANASPGISRRPHLAVTPDRHGFPYRHDPIDRAAPTAPIHGEQPSVAWHMLVVDGDTECAESLVQKLLRQGHEARWVGMGAAALRAYDSADMVLIDLDLPDLDGLEICRRIRASSDVPIIAVTGRSSELDRVLGLQTGADDYLVKPYGFRELMARIEAVMRRSRAHTAHRAPAVISHGPLLIDPSARQVRLDGRSIDLTRKEFDLLHLLATQPDAVISRKRIMNEVWGDAWSRRTIDTHVSSIRNKLGAPSWIVTVRGIGFQLGGHVTALQPPETRGAASPCAQQ